jgi:DNA invertase Pin-like site-specific DNA recombinase
MKIAAIYARVSSERQKEENTIASQTAALIEFAREQGFGVPDKWVIEDDGFSGASLLRPGLERLRDLAAEGHIQAVVIHSPDRLSRKYAYQVLLTEEFARHGVETIFIKAPHTGTPEDQLMLQFQGMIAEYERAQILERSRRGKRYRAKSGAVSVLCGAPYGYRYIRKTHDEPARYEVDTAEAEVVRLVYEKYTVDGLSIGAISRLLREMGPPTRRRVTRWERSVVWGMLRNPAYKGTACFNKTQVGPRQKVTKPFRLSGRAVHGEKTSVHERPRDEWIEVPVPAIVSEVTFSLAAERLADNKRFAPRRTIEPSRSCKVWYPAANAVMRCRALRRAAQHAKSTTTAAWGQIPGAISVAPSATVGQSARTCLTKSCGRRSSASSEIQISSVPNSTGALTRRAPPNRRSGGKKPSSGNSRASARVWSGWSRPTRKNFSRWTNCGTECQNSAPASRVCGQKCKLSSIRRPTGYRSCV